MKLSPRIVLLLSTTLVASSAFALDKPDAARTEAYIDRAWTTLTRSPSDCASLVDPKVTTRPVMYLPKDLPEPADIGHVEKDCGVQVRRLPRVIDRLGEVDSGSLPEQGLLYLPHPYVVPGGQFNEMYGWDSYFILLGLLADHREGLARDMVDNALFEVEHYGGVLNANRTYYLSRSQPPFLSAMIAAVLQDRAAFRGPDDRNAWLAHAYPLAVKNYRIWTSAAHRAGDTGLARYFDLGAGPVPEMRGPAYYRGVIDWARAHPTLAGGYLVKGAEHPTAAQAQALRRSSCDVKASPVCAGAWSHGYRLSADYYHGDRAMRESGFDTNFHFGPYGGRTHHYAGVGLNSLLYRYESELHDFALALGKSDEAGQWAQAAAARRAAIDKYLWRPQRGLFMDYDFVAGKPSDQPYLTTYYPLWAGLATPAQARAVRDHLDLFEHKGGLAMDNRHSGAQWNGPFGWAPTNWLAISGLDAYGFHDDARRLATRFTTMIDANLARTGTIREKYDMATASSDVKITAGYTQNVIGFGWTNAVYLKLRQLLAQEAPEKPAQ